jgi:hypothetical protein
MWTHKNALGIVHKWRQTHVWSVQHKLQFYAWQKEVED